jgi:hypothetical protein
MKPFIRRTNRDKKMSKAVPWSIKGVDFDVREAAKEAARRDGVTLGEWMNRAIADRAAEIGISAQEFDADERLEAVAAQLARLSRETEGDALPPRRRAEPAARQDRVPAARQERAPAPRQEREPVARTEDAEWDDDLLRERAARRRASTERAPSRPAPRDFFARTEAEDTRPPRTSGAAAPGRDEEDADEYIVRGARGGVASRDVEPPHMRLDERLAEIERRLKREEKLELKQEIKPLHGMIASVQDRLGEIETRLTKRDRFAPCAARSSASKGGSRPCPAAARNCPATARKPPTKRRFASSTLGSPPFCRGSKGSRPAPPAPRARNNSRVSKSVSTHC